VIAWNIIYMSQSKYVVQILHSKLFSQHKSGKIKLSEYIYTYIQTKATMKLVNPALNILLAAAISTAAKDSAKVLRGGPSPTTDGDTRKLQPRIINGIDAPVNHYPYTASLQYSYDNFHFCGGSLIAPDLVISAAHCVVDLSEPTRIVLNLQKLSDPIEASEVFSVQEYVSHPLYQTLDQEDHDYMIIKLTGSSSLPTLRLNTNENLPVTGSSLQVMGWGTTVVGESPVAADTLQEVNVVTITNEECSKASIEYEEEITPDMLCAAEVNQGSCQGDSGGPLVIPGSSSEEDVQVGIVSWGIGCAEPERKLICRFSGRVPLSQQISLIRLPFLYRSRCVCTNRKGIRLDSFPGLSSFQQSSRILWLR
jgi:trypsin